MSVVVRARAFAHPYFSPAPGKTRLWTSPQRQLRLLPRGRRGPLLTPAAVYEKVHCTRITLRARP